MISVYGLYDPRTDALRYVGHTKNVKDRYRIHCWSPSVSLSDWIMELKLDHLRPKLVILTECQDQGQVASIEEAWIRLARLSAGAEQVLNVQPHNFYKKDAHD